MVFSSYTFLFYFLPPLLALYYLIPRPPIVMVDGEKDYVAVRRETFQDLAAREL